MQTTNNQPVVNVYLAGSMFCEADRHYNAYLAARIRELPEAAYINLYVPQENASINDKTQCADSRAIFWGDYNRIKTTDILIARIDGDIPPSGTSAEIGMMAVRAQHWLSSQPTPMILGLCTDSRNPRRTFLEAKNNLMRDSDYESQYCYFNLFTIGCIKENGVLATSVEEMLQTLSYEVRRRVEWQGGSIE